MKTCKTKVDLTGFLGEVYAKTGDNVYLHYQDFDGQCEIYLGNGYIVYTDIENLEVIK